MDIRRAAALICLVVAGCASSTQPASPSPATVPPSPSIESSSVASPPASSVPSGSATAETGEPGEAPPDASLATEGGDPVTAQLGTYIWRDGGSDSPWLPGAPIAMAAGEPLTVTFEPAIGIASWRARLVPATADGPAGAATLGQGSGPLVFTAPAPGTWTVEVAVVFADSLGDARYFWRLEVT